MLAWKFGEVCRPRKGRPMSSRTLSYLGETLTVQEWAKRYHIAETTLYRRLNKGWSVERALTTKKISSSQAGKNGRLKSPWQKYF